MFHCPFCKHKKKKLALKIKEGVLLWHCWVCQKKGRSAKELLDIAHATEQQREQINKYLPTYRNLIKEKPRPAHLTLPHNCKKLYLEGDVTNQKAYNYVLQRGLDEVDIIRYNIQSSIKGKYNKRIIIPSYDRSGILQGFISRTYENSSKTPYLNPEGLNNIIFFEHLINWNCPIVLCEGVFDAMTIKHNAIPLLGKRLNPKLRVKLLKSKVQDVYVALDQDAKYEALDLCKQLIDLWKTPHLVELNEGDPADLGHEKMYQLIQSAEVYNEEKLLKNIIYGNYRGWYGYHQKKFRTYN